MIKVNLHSKYTSTEKADLSIKGKSTSGNVVPLNDELGNVFFWDIKAQDGGDWDDESDFKLSGGIGDSYNLEIASYYKTNELSTEMTDILKTAYKATHDNADMSNGQMILYNNQVYVWVSDTHGYSGFKKIKGQCGKGGADTLTSDLKGALGW